MANDATLAGEGAIFVQVDGPNTRPYFLGCHAVGDIEEPKGDKNLIYCKDASGQNKFRVARSYRSAAGPGSASIEALLHISRDWLEEIDTPVVIHVNKALSGRPDQFTNFGRAFALRVAEITSNTYQNLAVRDPDDQDGSMYNVEISFDELLRFFTLLAGRQATTETEAANAIAFVERGEGFRKTGRVGVIGCEAGAGVPATVLLTDDYGTTWVAAAADPFGNDESIKGAVILPLDVDRNRIIVAREGVALAAPEIALSDDGGATWTVIEPGTTVATGCRRGGGLFALNLYNIWYATDAGIIYRSADGGLTWVTQEAGVLTVEDLNGVHFADEQYGVAVGTNDTILITNNGGLSWELAAPTGSGDDILCCWRVDADTIWVGLDVTAGDYSLMYSNDGGLTWNPGGVGAFAGIGAGEVSRIVFINSLRGFLAHNDGTPVGRLYATRDGGYHWEGIDTPDNDGLNDLWVGHNNLAASVGEPEAATAVILRTSEG